MFFPLPIIPNISFLRWAQEAVYLAGSRQLYFFETFTFSDTRTTKLLCAPPFRTSENFVKQC
jgi:hypothetical protein